MKKTVDKDAPKEVPAKAADELAAAQVATPRTEPVAAREEISLTKNVEPETKAKAGKRYWMEVSENVAGFMNFDPKIVFLMTENAEQEANLSRMTFEITKAEYDKRTK